MREFLRFCGGLVGRADGAWPSTDFKRMLRGGKREYRKHGISALIGLMAWYMGWKVAPSLQTLYYTRIFNRDVDNYDIPLDPYNLIWVHPDSISHKTNRERIRWASFQRNFGSVKGGDWDRNLDGEFTSRHESFKAHFEDGVPWKDTPFYEKAMEAISTGEYTLRMSTSKEEVLQRCAEIDALYEKIKREGYKTQNELGTYDSKLYQIGNEVQVDIGRDGSLLFIEGRHRLSLAKILNIEEVPVIVVCRHREWMEQLEQCYQRGARIDHPDWDSVRTDRETSL